VPRRRDKRSLADPGEQARAVFGSQYRLPTLFAVAIAKPEELYAAAIAEQSGAPVGQVGKDLHRLEEVGLLDEMPQAKGAQILLYRRADSPLWEHVEALGRAWGLDRHSTRATRPTPGGTR